MEESRRTDTPVTRRAQSASARSRSEADRAGADIPFTRLGHFEVLRRIGHGGMGDVYQGYDPSLERNVAIKVLPTELAREEEFVSRFRAEATAAAGLVHPHIIQIYFIGEDGGNHFFAMQYVEGESLADLLRRKQRLGVEETLAIVLQVLSGLASAHARDIANANISDAGLVHVAGLTHLNSLDLDRTKITDAGLEHLAGLLWLQRLSLQGTAIDGSGFRHLRNLKSLSSLDLMGSGVTDAGLSHLAELTSLRSLLLLGAPVDGSGLRHLPDSLRQLSVDRLSDRDLASIRALPFMTELHMRHARLSDEGLKVLLQAKTLEELSLGPDIGDRSVIYLCELDSLRRLHMESMRITKSGKDELDKALPMCTVYWTPPR